MPDRPRTLTCAVMEVALATALGAALISMLAGDPSLVALLLAGLVVAHLAHRVWHGERVLWVFDEVFLLTTTGVIGYLTEAWGTTHGHWTYAHLPPGSTVPVWVPIAWMLASVLLDRIDDCVGELQLPIAARVGVAAGAGIVFPWLGESICIASGVWQYHWPLQLAGVPVLALLLISYAHWTFALIRQGTNALLESQG
ncbi:MAG: hypothetical protein U0900_04900 [Myxococcota bacterium]